MCKVDEMSKNMTKHSLSGIQSLNNFMFTESEEIIAWWAYNVGPGMVSYLQRRWRVSVPLKARKTYNLAFCSPDMLTGIFRAPSRTREQPPRAPTIKPIAVERIQLEEEESVVFGCP